MKRIVWVITVVSLLVMFIPGLSLSANLAVGQHEKLNAILGLPNFIGKKYLPIILKGYSKNYQLTCWSVDYQPNQCSSPIQIHNVSIVVQVSDAECIQNQTWGFTSSFIWVKDGCRATFTINPFQLTCWSVDYQPNQCNSPIEIHNASVAVQDSDADCIQNQTWGFTAHYIWVDDGCRATFNIN
jgi:hypothetical protein